MNRLVIAAVAAGALISSAACGVLGVAQSKECKDYVACAEKISPGTKSANDGSFGPGGTCWLTQPSADTCTSTCKTGNDAYKANGSAADAGCAL